MRRANLVLALASSAVVVALVTLGSGIDSHRLSSTTVELRRGEAGSAHHTSSIDTRLNSPTTVVTLPSSDGNREQNDTNQDQPDLVVYSRDGGVADEITTRKIMRESAAKDIRRRYAWLLEGLDLTPQEREALLALLIEDRIASTSTLYKHGEPIGEEEQSRRIAAIIGDRKLQQFRDLESNLGAYVEAYSIGSLLEKNGVPLTGRQRDGLLKILIATRDRYAATPLPADVKPDSIESLEHLLTQRSEYERHLMELVPSVLSAQQVVYLDQQYQYLSYKRVNSLERQRRERANGTGAKDSPLSFPVWVGD